MTVFLPLFKKNISLLFVHVMLLLVVKWMLEIINHLQKETADNKGNSC
jgi:hypothetical protein